MALSFWSSPRKDLNLVERADDFQAVPVDQDRLAEGISVGEEPLAHAVPDYGYVAAVAVVNLAEEAALVQRGVENLQVIRGDAHEEGIVHILAFVSRGDRRQAEFAHIAKQLRGDGLGGRALLLDGHGILVAQRLAQAFVASQLMRGAHLQLVDP